MLMEPIMLLEVQVPLTMYQGVMAEVTKRGGNIINSEPKGDLFIIEARIALSKMFGFSGVLRGATQGLGEFSMEYWSYEMVNEGELMMIIDSVREKKGMHPLNRY